MREIKFRAWDKNRNMFLEQENLIIANGQIFESFRDLEDWTPENNSTLMQYTGLKDKNGVEIYEGDIDQEDTGEINVIVYLKKAGSYCVMPLDIYLNEDYQEENYFPQLLYNFGYDWTFDNQVPGKYLNIVGNIYENPELLEVQND